MKKKKKHELMPLATKQDMRSYNISQGQCPVHFSTCKDGESGSDRINASVRTNPGLSNEKQAYMEALKKFTGAQDLELAAYTFVQGVTALKKGDNECEAYNLVAQFLSESNPKDALEAFLFNQILVLQELGMISLRRMEKAEMMVQSEYNMKTAAKLFHLQHSAIDKLLKYRTGGEQKVVVQHVNVENGGRAVVGNFNATGGGCSSKSEEPHG